MSNINLNNNKKTSFCANILRQRWVFPLAGQKIPKYQFTIADVGPIDRRYQNCVQSSTGSSRQSLED